MANSTNDNPRVGVLPSETDTASMDALVASIQTNLVVDNTSTETMKEDFYKVQAYIEQEIGVEMTPENVELFADELQKAINGEAVVNPDGVLVPSTSKEVLKEGSALSNAKAKFDALSKEKKVFLFGIVIALVYFVFIKK